jgi:hypothetical protein
MANSKFKIFPRITNTGDWRKPVRGLDCENETRFSSARPAFPRE